MRNSMQEPTARYDNIAISLHWLLALMIVGSFAMGLYMTSLPFSIQRVKLFNWHKWAGITILTLSALRLFWRLRHPPPPEVPGPHWQQLAAKATHRAMYVLFFAIPLVGWAYSSAAGLPIVVFGVLPLPDLLPTDKALADSIKPWHGRLAYALAALVLLHAAAALKHHFIDRDGLLHRMRPGRA
jgi:cytochrome b561